MLCGDVGDESRGPPYGSGRYQAQLISKMSVHIFRHVGLEASAFRRIGSLVPGPALPAHSARPAVTFKLRQGI